MSTMLHPRTQIVGAARAAIADAIRTAITTHSLTYSELTYILAKEILAWANYGIQDEREQDEPKQIGEGQ